ncbi:hypothetical protein L1987_19278 [Smallanthus sonchifolius]|uniref:Uncharacterized protein n=1 Tax=Smallanthus sonchifolius TaxID=185202 RepID=A0ACB9IQ98_9ASTR|nr:hypothetical protein L1987_19278 [Smallanthus sonchifolius]
MNGSYSHRPTIKSKERGFRWQHGLTYLSFPFRLELTTIISAFVHLGSKLCTLGHLQLAKFLGCFQWLTCPRKVLHLGPINWLASIKPWPLFTPENFPPISRSRSRSAYTRIPYALLYVQTRLPNQNA